MNINTYQEEAAKTAIYKDKLIYPTLGLAGEAGEMANKVKKVLRDNAGELSDEVRKDLIKELGDVMWYCAALATDLGTSLGEICFVNIEKLKSRQERNQIGGSGDNR
jgi:NTP pyrophosphatase (non-canonical NTP hydrolase)